MEHLDLLLELLHPVEGLVRLAEALLEDGLHAHEDRHAAAVGRQLDHLLVVAQEERGLAAPLDVQRRSEEHTSELQSRLHLVCRLLLEKKKKTNKQYHTSSN